MGTTRTLLGKCGEKVKLDSFMKYSSVFCIGSYLLLSLSSNPIFSIVGIISSGVSVGIMWPGTISLAVSSLKSVGVSLFALFALGGDTGCSLGLTVVGQVATYFNQDFKM